MSIEAWDEIRTAYHVARAGTVSGAAVELGVHHATVIRHIDALEALMQRQHEDQSGNEGQRYGEQGMIQMMPAEMRDALSLMAQSFANSKGRPACSHKKGRGA